MATPETISNLEVKKDVYSVWALPPEDVGERVKKLMEGLRSEFGGPQFEPHITVVGAITLTADDALNKFDQRCVYLLVHPTVEVVETSAHCSSHLGYRNSTPYMPHLSILYGDLTDDEKKRASRESQHS
ncbi:cyclic phosphodiesterase-like [Quillaja saponaria]|uniref:Cyclic phosphodiesterase-like n=1 Tax=Quillaja saponaria TaxID=32244 RepID=A0AAD7PUL6_QUISA|nr:cyclic phosphodiesterase-like [Quillaja saponaria]